VGDDGGDRQAEQQAQREQQPDRELLAAAGRGHVEPEGDRERAEEQNDPGPAGQVAAEVSAERGEADGDGDVAHDLAEQRSGVAPYGVTDQRLVVECAG
jgi:hypothetical protein